MNVAPLETLRSRGISAGIFAAPLGHLERWAAAFAGWGGSVLHFDIMDGVFVPEITGGAGFVKALGAGMVRDVHLMVADPAAQVAAFALAGADIITVHAEAPTARAALEGVRAAARREQRTILAGLAVMPGTPLERLTPLMNLAPDLILVLAIDPRTDTPPDLALAGERLRRLAQMAAPHRPSMALDGGITEGRLEGAAATGADLIVSGSAIFRAADPAAAYHRMVRVLQADAAGARELRRG